MAPEMEERFQTLQEIVKAARQNLAPGPWDYLAGGAESETTLRRNRQALDSLAFRPRVLRDVSSSTHHDAPRPSIRMPVMLAPIGSHRELRPGRRRLVGQGLGRVRHPADAELGVQSGARSGGEAADNFRIFQLYVRGDDAWVDDHVKRARDHGYARVLLSRWTPPSYSRRERDLAKRFVKPWRTRAAGFNYQAALSWDHVKRFKDTHPDMPLASRASPQRKTRRWPSSTAWRSSTSPITAAGSSTTGAGAWTSCPRSSTRSTGRATVLVDGAFMRGTDVVKAIALGANAVGVGRLECLGLAAAGVPGLVRALELLEEEIRICLGLLGVPTLAGLNHSYLHAATPVTRPHVTSAFPLLEEGY